MKPNCYIDFDGTIVSNKERLFKFYKDNIPSNCRLIEDIDDFWTLKRYGINEAEWTKQRRIEVDIASYNKSKIHLIENKDYLDRDTLLPNIKQNLELLSEQYNLVLVSRRSNPENLLWEIRKHGLTSYFKDIIIVPHGILSKAVAIKEKFTVSPHDIFVGDTEDDISAGVQLGIRTYLVLTGIRDKWILSMFDNNTLVRCISTIEDIIQIKSDDKIS